MNHISKDSMTQSLWKVMRFPLNCSNWFSNNNMLINLNPQMPNFYFISNIFHSIKDCYGAILVLTGPVGHLGEDSKRAALTHPSLLPSAV